MEKLYCWRCKTEVGMLDEGEFAIAVQLIDETPSLKRFQPMLDYYEELTGEKETNPNVFFHHRIALYGPPCENCGKPYRTPKASLCPACGNKRDPLDLL